MARKSLRATIISRYNNKSAKDAFMSITVSFTLNGESVSAGVDNHTLLVDMIRDQLGHTGTHVGCDTSQCGACVIHVDGRSVKSCTMLAVQAEGADVQTIEGVLIESSIEADGPLAVSFEDAGFPYALKGIRGGFLATA